MPRSPAATRSIRLVEAEGHPPLVDLDDAFRRFAPLIAHVSLRILGRPQEVDDLVQDVFVEAGRWLQKIDSPAAFKYWLLKVAVREARRRLRRRRWRATFGLDDATDYSGVVDPAASTSQRAFVGELYRVLDRLPVNQRIAWTLRYIEGESSSEVADRCSCSHSTAKRWIMAAHRAIQEAFGDE